MEKINLPDVNGSHEVSKCVICKRGEENNRLGTLTQSGRASRLNGLQPFNLEFSHSFGWPVNSRPHFCLCCVSQHNLSSDSQPPSCVMAAASSLVASAFPSPFSRNAPFRGGLNTSLAVPVICGNRPAPCAVLSSPQANRTRPLCGRFCHSLACCLFSSEHRDLTCTRDLQLPFSREHPTFSALDNSGSKVTYFPKPFPCSPRHTETDGSGLSHLGIFRTYHSV